MKKDFSKTAFTLIELIVSLMLVSVIILGVFAISVVFRDNNLDFGQRYLVKSETQATLNHVLNNLSLAVGDGTNINGDVNYGIMGAGVYGVCVHQAKNNNIINSSSDIWLCYNWYGPGTATTSSSGPNQIWYCTMPYNTSSPGGTYLGAWVFPPFVFAYDTNACNPSVNPYINSGPTYLGTAAGFEAYPPLYSNGQLSASVMIYNCIDDSSPTCQWLGISTNHNDYETEALGSVVSSQQGLP